MRNDNSKMIATINRQAAHVLLRATFEFLERAGIPFDAIDELVRTRRTHGTPGVRAKQLRSVVRAYEEMGIIMSTWFTEPRFLRSSGEPAPLAVGRGRKSIDALVRASRVGIAPATAMKMFRQSPSVKFDDHGQVIALNRAFVMPEFEVPRASLIIERFLDTLTRNSVAQKVESPLLLERCCYVTGVNARHVAPIMRDIKGRGVAFMNSVDGEIEAHRVRKSARIAAGEMGVVTFAWIRSRKTRRPKRTTPR